MSIKERITNYIDPVDHSTKNKDYSAEELAEAAAEVFGKEKIETLNRTYPIPTANTSDVPVYSPRQGVGVKVNSLKDSAEDALDEAAERLDDDDQELLEQ